MNARAVYGTRPIKRHRSTRAEVEERRAALLAITAEMQPMTVRQVWYQATVRGIVEKVEADYKKVATDLGLLRRAGRLPYSAIADNTRWQRKPQTFNSISDALRETAAFYRKSLWRDAGVYVEIWIEKDALAGVVMPVTDEYDVPLMVARGFSSISFLHSAAEYIGSLTVPTFIYHVGDFDPSGYNASEKIEQTLREFAPQSEIHFERLGVNFEQIKAWGLPVREVKTKDPRAKKFIAKFGNISCELDSIDPHTLRSTVRDAIERHMPRHQLEILKAAEESERDVLRNLVGYYLEPEAA